MNQNEDYRMRREVEIAAAGWNAQLRQMRSALARHDELAGHDEHVDLRAYLSRRISEERESIAPELLDYIGGSTIDEVERSISTAKAKTQSILDGIRQAQPSANSPNIQGQPPQIKQQQTAPITAEQLAAMSPASPEYIALRQALGLDTAGHGRGIFDQ